jgi:hypothetical protein
MARRHYRSIVPTLGDVDPDCRHRPAWAVLPPAFLSGLDPGRRDHLEFVVIEACAEVAVLP